MAIIIVVLLAVIGLNFLRNKNTSNINKDNNNEKTKQKNNNSEETSSQQIGEIEANDILKEKAMNYKNITSLQTYCGDNSFDVTNELNNSLGMEDIGIISWKQSVQFSSYEEMKRFALNNISEEIYSKTRVADATFYKEKDGKLYCGQVGVGIYPADDIKYQVTSYDNDKIVGLVINIYSQDDVDNGISTSLEQKYHITIEKNDNNWIVTEYTLQ